MIPNYGKLFVELFNAVAVLCLIAVPLAIWKVIDIVIWIFSHLEWKW